MATRRAVRPTDGANRNARVWAVVAMIPAGCEGVEFRLDGAIDLARYRWRPGQIPSAAEESA